VSVPRWLIPRNDDPRWFTRALLFIAIVLALKIVYLAFACPYTLAEDEAHYWTWSRALDWSYYSKGPGVAWAIAASNAVCAPLGLADSEFAVRLPATLFAGIFALALADLSRRASGRASAAWVAALLSIVIPVYYASGLLMTIDMPLLAMWAIAAWGAWRAIIEDWRPGWLVLGAAIGIGVLFKYTMLLLIPGLLIGWWLARASHSPSRPAAARWKIAGGLLAMLGLVPILVWNAQRGWPTIAHLLGHLGMTGGDVPLAPKAQGWHYEPEWTLTLIGTQLALVGPAIGVLAAATIDAFRRRSVPEAATFPLVGHRLLAWLGIPVLATYLAVSFVTEPEGNWPIATYVTLIPLAAERLLRRAEVGRVPVMWRAAVVLAFLIVPISLRGDWLRFVPVLGQPWTWNGRDQRPLAPLGRLTSGDVMAADVARLAQQLADETGQEPIVIAQQYGRASVLEFYLHAAGEHDVVVLCASSLTGGRRTQYDLWPDRDLRDIARWQGRNAVIIGGEPWHWEPAFERVVDVGPLRGETKATRRAYLGYGYRGWPAPPGADR
jgi:4-amino-4-deoxy-L-arabinose transferase-like glycosyltransferase